MNEPSKGYLALKTKPMKNCSNRENHIKLRGKRQKQNAGMYKKVTFLRSTASGKKPVTSSGLGTELWVSSFLSFLRALTTTDADFLGLF